MIKPRFLIFLTVICLILTGCSGSTSISTPMPSPTIPLIKPPPITNTPTIKPSPITQASPTMTVEVATPTPSEITQAPGEALSDYGLWWVFTTTTDLYAIKPDGSELTPFNAGPLSPHLAQQTVSSLSEGYIAFITGEGLEATLIIRQLPYLTCIIEKPLFSYQGDIEMEAMRAVTDYQSLAFSPDGLNLAFVGAIDGPTSDLYVYSPDTFEMLRLSDGPSQAYQPSWSPNGKTIVFVGASSFGTGAGVTVTKVWAAQADGSEIMGLYEPSQSGGETIIGWLDDETFLVHSWSPVCGNENLRTFNISTKESTILWAEPFQAVAFDPYHDVVLISSHENSCSPAGGTGFYWISTDGTQPLRVLEFPQTQLSWSSEAENFMATSNFTGGVLVFDHWGQYIDLDMPMGAGDFPAVAPLPYKTLAWPGEGLWIGPFLGSLENPPVKIFEEPVDTVTWTPYGESLMYLTGGSLFMAQRPDYTPILIAAGLGTWNGFAAWVEPFGPQKGEGR